MVKPLVSACSRTARAPALAVAVTIGVMAGVMSATPAGAAQQEVANGGGGIIDRVLVRVGDQAILHSEFEAEMQDYIDTIAAQLPQEQIDALMQTFRMQTMAGLVQQAILVIRADELGIEASANQIDRALANMRETNGLLDDTQWQQALEQSGMTEAQLRDDIAGTLVFQLMLQQEVSRNVITSMREAQIYYDENPEQFTEPEEVLYQQLIFVYQGSDRAPVRERAENALAELRSGASLTAVSDKYIQGSAGDLFQDASGANWISPEDIRPEVSAAISDLTPLTYSEVIEGPFGYHIVQLMDRREGGLVPFEEVADQVRGMLNNQKMDAKMDEYIAGIFEDITLEIYAEEFEGLREALLRELQGASTGSPGQR